MGVYKYFYLSFQSQAQQQVDNHIQHQSVEAQRHQQEENQRQVEAQIQQEAHRIQQEVHRQQQQVHRQIDAAQEAYRLHQEVQREKQDQILHQYARQVQQQLHQQQVQQQQQNHQQHTQSQQTQTQINQSVLHQNNQQSQHQVISLQPAIQHKGRMPRGKADARPRGRMTAYAFFVQTCREEHKKKHPEENVVFAEFSKKCAERWKVRLCICYYYSLTLFNCVYTNNFYLRRISIELSSARYYFNNNFLALIFTFFP